MNTTLITKAHNGIAFTFREDGWFNMTKAAKAFGKDIKDFFDNKSTQDYVEALQLVGGIGPTKQAVSGNGKSPSVGTWGHPKLAVFFARWLSIPFGVWCDAVIDDILKGNAELVITKPEQSAVMALPQEVTDTVKLAVPRGARML